MAAKDTHAAQDTTPVYTVELLDTGEAFACRKDQVVLKAMLALGHKGIPSGCHGGGCGVCKVKVERGEVHALPMSAEHIGPQQRRDNIVLACRTFARSDLQLSVAGKMKMAIEPRRYGFV